MRECAFHHAFRGRMSAMRCKDVFRKRACIDADTDGDMLFLRHIHHFHDVFPPADISGIDAKRIDALLHRCQRKAIVEMNVCDQRHIHFRTKRAKCFCCLFIRYGDPDDICARLMQGMDLRSSSVRIERAERAHRLDRNGRAPTDLDTADNDLFGISHLNLLFVVVYMNVWFRVKFAFLKTSCLISDDWNESRPYRFNGED